MAKSSVHGGKLEIVQKARVLESSYINLCMTLIRKIVGHYLVYDLIAKEVKTRVTVL